LQPLKRFSILNVIPDPFFYIIYNLCSDQSAVQSLLGKSKVKSLEQKARFYVRHDHLLILDYLIIRLQKLTKKIERNGIN